MQEQALNSILDMSNILLKGVLVKKSISESTLKAIIDPIAQMDWQQKKKYADETKEILIESSTEQEIIQKVQSLQDTLIEMHPSTK